MLKIKDNVDLKELEKFGFEYIVDNYVEKYVIKNAVKPKPYWRYKEIEKKNKTVVSIRVLDRKITFSSFKGQNDLCYCK